MIHYDLCVIGGGINGAGIARDAAGRGLSVLLVEAKDLGSATSSSSSKMIHGGLRYLEYLEFRLVREALAERETLLHAAPHIVRPLELVLPHDKTMRPYWMLQAGLYLYDHLAGRQKLKDSRPIDFSTHAYGDPLKPSFARGFAYADCWVDDSRLVVLNAVDAAARGAEIRTKTACSHLEQEEEGWMLSLVHLETTGRWHPSASMVVNAAGPWVRGVLEGSDLAPPSSRVPHIRLVKGSHIITQRLYEGDQAYILQCENKRVVFVFPYEKDLTLIGTTEVAYEGDPADAMISDEETAYLCNAVSQAFKKQITPEDVEWAFSGVRPLFDKGKGKKSDTAASRDYYIHDHLECRAPLLSVFGGKITTYRVLAENVVDKLVRKKGMHAPAWTKNASLPGGDIAGGDMDAFLKIQAEQYPWLPRDLLQRYVNAYGTCMDRFLAGAWSLSDLGEHVGDGLYEAEILYMIRTELARDPEDIMWRRSKLGLHAADKTFTALEQFLNTQRKNSRKSKAVA